LSFFQTEEDEEEESEPIYQNQGQILIAQQQLGQQQQLDQQQQQQLNHQQQQLNLQQQLLEQQQQQLLEQQQQLLEQQQEQQEIVPGQEPIYQNLPLHEKLNQSYTGEDEQDESIHIGQYPVPYFSCKDLMVQVPCIKFHLFRSRQPGSLSFWCLLWEPEPVFLLQFLKNPYNFYHMVPFYFHCIFYRTHLKCFFRMLTAVTGQNKFTS
jgi:hypothetical protein